MSAVGDTLQVIFSVSRQEVAKAQPLQVPRTLYLQCAQLRRDRCALYQNVYTVDAQRAEETLRDDEAPPEIAAAVVHMSEANLFRPNLTGPAGSELVACLLTYTEQSSFKVKLIDIISFFGGLVFTDYWCLLTLTEESNFSVRCANGMSFWG